MPMAVLLTTGQLPQNVKSSIDAEETAGWQTSQVLIPLNETMCAGGVLGCQVMFERAQPMSMYGSCGAL